MPTTKANIREAPIRLTAAALTDIMGKEIPAAAVIPARGDCGTCPLNQYGSGKNGAKACKNRRRLYLLREGDIFPVILSLPTGSLKAFTRYLMRVIPKYKNSNAVVTKFTLKKAVSGTGMSYSQAQFAVERALSPEEYPLIAAVTEQVKALSKNVGYDTEDALRVDPETGEVMEPLN